MRHRGDGTQARPARGKRARLLVVVAALLASAGCAVPAGSPSAGTAPPSASPGLPLPTLTPVATLPDLAGAGSCHAADGGFLPDHLCTMGAVDPRVTQGNIAATICRSGYTATVRPPESVTEPIKVERLAAYGISAPLAMYELDHLIPLELGGASTVTNLWPEPLAGSRGAHRKDDLENAMRRQVCSGAVSLAVAQLAIATNWEDAYQTFVGPLS
jgi:hypothetical protein